MEFRQWVDQSPTAAFICVDSRICYANQAAAQLTGYTLEQLLQLDPAELISPNKKTFAESIDTQLHAGASEPFSDEIPITTAQGENRWLHTTRCAIAHENSSAMLMTAIDITDLKQAREHLSERRERATMALECAAEGFWEWDLETGAAEFSDRWMESLGYRNKAVVPTIAFWRSLVHPDDIKLAQLRLESHISGESDAYECVYRLRTQTGEYRWTRDHGRIVRRNSNGVPTGVIGTSTDLTEQMRTQSLPRQTQNRMALKSDLLQTLFNATPDLIFVKDRQSRTLLCNQAFARAVGKKPEDMYGRTDLENGWDPTEIHGDPSKGVRGYLDDDRDALAGQPTFDRRDVVHIDGVKRIFRTHKLPLADSDGQIVGVLGLSRDVTELEKISDQLRRSESNYRALVQDTAIFIARFTASFEVEFVNDAFCKAFDIKPNDLVGKTFLHLIADDQRDDVVASLRGLTPESPVQINENEVILPDGTRRWHRWTNRAVFDKKQVLTAYHAVGEDITHRKMSEQTLQESYDSLEAKIAVRTADLTRSNESLRNEIAVRQGVESSLRKSERLLKVIAHTIEDVCRITDISNQRVLFVSNSYEEIWGRQVDDLYSDPRAWTDAIIKEDRQRVIESFARLREGKSYDQEYRIMRPDGSIRWIRDRGSSLAPSGDATQEVVGIAQDVTQFKQFESELHARGVALAHLSRVSTVGQIASEVAHELNQPLTVIANFASGIRPRISGTEHASDIGKAIDRIITQCMNAKELTRRIHRFVRQDTPKREPFAVSRVIANASEMVLSNARQNDVQIVLDTSNSEDVVVGNALEIEHVIINLMINAIESMTRLVDQPRILTVQQKNDAEHVTVSVCDTGVGVGENLRAKVFDSFFTTKDAGLGLGLAICKTTIEEHGGAIWIEENGSGSIFSFRLYKQ
ncbi:MAG: PAS domain S-box protein [Phycisphaerales bacterium]|nr:PAS domain S-box protein [Phycisphaerales bacterium]